MPSSAPAAHHAARPCGILVVGGGPAGAAISIALARQGKAVTLVEKSAAAHDKVCGEFVSGESRTYLDALGVDIDALGALPVRKVRVAAHAVLAEELLPFPAWSLRRAVLDEALLGRAASEGVAVKRGAAVKTLMRHESGWKVQLTHDSAPCHDALFQDAFLATGKHDLRGWQRGSGRQNDLVAFKVRLALTAAQAEQLRACIELVFFREGYAGLQLVEGRIANMSLLLTRRALRTTGSQWSGILRHLLDSSAHLRQRLAASQPESDRPLALSAIPYGYQRAHALDGSWALGDQAAVIPSFTGDGISIALHSAFVAARAYGNGKSAEEYQHELASQLRRPVALATALSRAVIAAPLLVQAVRLYPRLVTHIANLTRVPARYHERAAAAPCMQAAASWQQ